MNAISPGFTTAFLDELRERTPLRSLVERRVELKKAGRGWKGCCPFHNERSPSFYVYPQRYHCFGCGADGDAIEFAKQTQGLSFVDAVAQLAGEVGLEMPDVEPTDPAEALAAKARAAAQRAEAEKRRAQRDAEAAADEAKRVRWANATAAEGAAIEGTLAEWYLNHVRRIPTPERGWPGCLRWHTRRNALVALATLQDGTIRAVHRIHFDEEGEKLVGEDLARAGLTSAKITNGPLAGAAVRLPGDPAGPLLVAEGVETALSGWSVTGFETWAVLGGLSRVDLPEGRRVVLLGEDYAPDHKALIPLRTAVERWQEKGCDFCFAMPWATRQHDGSDLNDTLRRLGPDAVLKRIEIALRGEDSVAPLLPAKLARSETPSGKHGLPAYYDAPIEPREQALARQRDLIRSVILDGAVGASIRRKIAAKREAALGFDKDQLTPGKKGAITRRVRREVLAAHGLIRAPSPRRVLVTGSQGTGKTSTTLSSIAEIPAVLKSLGDLSGDLSIRVTQPSLDKAAEVVAAYEEIAEQDSLPAVLIRGRGADDPSRPEGTKMCGRDRIVHRAARKGVQVRKAICASCPMRPMPLQTGCGYMRQEAAIEAMGGRGLFVMSAAYNFLPCPAPDADILVADEAITITAIDAPLRISPDVLENPVPASDNRVAEITWARKIGARLRAALVMPGALAELRRQGPTEDELRALKDTLESVVEARQDARISGDLSDAQIDKVLDDIETNAAVLALALISAVLRELDQPRDVFNGISYDPAARVMVDGKEERQPRIIVHRLRPLRGVTKDTTVLLLDGTGSPRLNAALLPNLEHHRISVERTAHVTGTTGRSYSRQSVTGEDRNGDPIPNRVADADRLRREVREIAARLPGDTLIVSMKRAAEKMQDEGVQHVAHFAKLRGMNEWENCQSGISLGMQALSVEAAEDLARPFMVDDAEAFVSLARPMDAGWGYEQWPFRATRGRRMRDGSVLPVEVEVHPDLRVQEVLEQVREAEVLQGIDRPRPVFNERTLVAMNSLALDLTYDRVLSHKELVAGGNRFELALAELGFLPLGAPDLHRACRRLFPSEKSAEKALAAGWESPPLSQIQLYLEKGGAFSYRRKGQRGSSSRVLVDVRRHPNPRAALEAVLGTLAGDPVLLSPEPPDLPDDPAPPPPEPPHPPPADPPPEPRPRPPPCAPEPPSPAPAMSATPAAPDPLPAGADARLWGAPGTLAASVPWAPSASARRGSGAPSIEATWGAARDG